LYHEPADRSIFNIPGQGRWQPQPRAHISDGPGDTSRRLDAQDHLLRALAVTQSEHGTQLRKLASEQARLTEEQVRTAGTLARVEAGVRTIIGLLDQNS
jgi:hypothetical protein